MMLERIKTKLTAAFTPHYLNVLDESHHHRVPAGAESHFNVVIVSEQFIDKRALTRHRAVYDVLAAELLEGVHALALHTYTLDEWKGAQHEVPASPDCYGGEKSASQG